MSKTTTLASGQITPTDTLLVELREPDELPASILITWPQAPSVVDPHRFGATANAFARLMATAITTLAQIRAYEPEQERTRGFSYGRPHAGRRLCGTPPNDRPQSWPWRGHQHVRGIFKSQ
jgi:hypothetical protein